MKKIPVGATIAHAYGFAFGDFLKILGVMWLPMAITWLPGILFRSRIQALSAQMMAHDFSAMSQMMTILLPLYLVSAVLAFMLILGIAQQALGTRQGSPWFYFALGKPLWRLIGSVILLVVAVLIGWIVVWLGIALLAVASGFLTKLIVNSIFAMLMGAIVVVLSAALWCGWFYSVVRLGFLLTPVVAAGEPGFALGRAWTLGLGNFWRMFGVLLVTALPFLLLEGVAIYFVMKGISLPAGPAGQAAYQAAVNARTQALIDQVMHYWYISSPIGIALMVILYGSVTGAQCFAYKALASDEVAGG